MKLLILLALSIFPLTALAQAPTAKQRLQNTIGLLVGENSDYAERVDQLQSQLIKALEESAALKAKLAEKETTCK